MITNTGVSRGESVLLWATFLVYVVGRVCQQYPDKIPTLTIVANAMRVGDRLKERLG